MESDAPVLASEPLTSIIEHIRSRLLEGAGVVRLRVLDPDRGAGRYAGEPVVVGERAHRHRPLRVWVDLADRMGLRLSTPRPDGEGLMRLELRPLDPTARWEPGDAVPVTEKYGAGSGYQRIDKAEDPGLVLDLADALERVGLGPGARVLDLGVNTGEELQLLGTLWPELARSGCFVGVDHSASAIEVARSRFSDSTRHHFVCAELAALPELPLGEPFDLVIALGTLHSPGVDDRAVLRHVVQQRLRSNGSVILGVPNCRYVDGEQLHGARMKNFRQPELSLLVKGVAFWRRYLQQHRRKVYVTGKHTVLVTGVPSGRAGAVDVAAPE
ncbi:class I SAM-dependent methyltransferase [Paraliomyxa miuraensis]|uniref:class I SAM-dependent methyltransferase n=1 Tax=Paraliomyxa miuraensis TaxID=376150 RepID=UPI002255E2C4|nr:class I SAM-dependent methyltransferase [Paraliomyxa miuraensis]MCX4247961.1 class I SAM-dependent methyltransferase [Paraliomyxa miuraensis]